MTSDTIGGVWSYTLDLLAQFAKKKIRTTLVTEGRLPSREQSEQIQQIPGVTLVPTEYRLEWMPEPWDDIARCGELLLRLERENRPDIVHLNGFAHGKLPFFAPKVIVSHSCVLSWWRAVKGRYAPDNDWGRYLCEVQQGIAAADLLIAPTQAMLDALRDEYVVSTKTLVIHNGSEIGTLGTCAKKENIVFSAGRIWDEAKNIAALCMAAEKIEVPVYIAGEQARTLNGVNPSHESVNMLGALSRATVRHWMERADIYCLPALYEPFGLSILEAARAGCALVLGDIPSLREVWGDDCACFVDPHDPQAIARCINTLIADSCLRHAMQANALARSEKYSVQTMADAYAQAYEHLLAVPTPVAA